MKLATAEQIKKGLMQDYDPQKYDSMYRQIAYAFGEPWKNRLAPSLDGNGDFPDRADVVVRFQEIGRSRRILNTQFISLSRNMYAQPSPEFKGIDRYEGEVRKQFYLARYNDPEFGGEWAEEMSGAYMDADGVGLGVVEIGTATNPETGLKRVHLSHVPACQVIGDRHERNPGRWRRIAFVKYLPVDIAEERFGRKVVHSGSNIRRLFDSTSSQSLDVMRVIEVYDTGRFGREPTYAVVPSNLANDPISIEPNPFGCLPFSYMIHFLAPGMRYPVGKISLQMAMQEAINELERGLRRVMRQRGVDVMDMSRLDAQDVKRWLAGDENVTIKFNAKGDSSTPIHRIGAAEAASTWLQLREMYERQFNADSGTTEMDRGSLSSERRTLGENMILDERSQAAGSWSDLQAVKFHRRTVERVLRIAADHDRDPVMLDFFGYTVAVNVPGDPRTTVAEFLRKPARVVIGEDSLKKSDLRAERAEKIQMMKILEPLVGTLIDPVWFTEELIKATGIEDPQRAMIQGMTGPTAQAGMTSPFAPAMAP